MSKPSIWKRFGDWLSRRPGPEVDVAQANLDDDGLLVEPSLDETETNANSVAPGNALTRNSKKNQLAAMEENFNRLVDVLESINDSVKQQREVSEELRETFGSLSGAMKNMPETLETQKNLTREVSEHMRNQVVHYQRVTEVLSNLPDINQDQLDKLDDITQQLQNSAQADTRIADSLKQVDNNIDQMTQTSQQQLVSMQQMNEMLAQSQKKTQEMLAKQNRRFGWALVIVVLVVVAAVLYKVFVQE